MVVLVVYWGQRYSVAELHGSSGLFREGRAPLCSTTGRIQDGDVPRIGGRMSALFILNKLVRRPQLSSALLRNAVRSYDSWRAGERPSAIE